jgi:hypothetical protein
METKRQGYIVLALGPEHYVAMAANLAASIKVMDPSRKLCLVHDQDMKIPSKYAPLFDDTVGLPMDPLYPHVMNKLRLFDVSPYEQTMFIDADCLLVKRDVDVYWRAAATRSFSVTGGKKYSGEWKGVQVEDVLRQEGADYLVSMNAGVFYFDKSEESRMFFKELNDFYLRRREYLNISIYGGVRTQTDELYLGVFMGLNHMDCDNVNNIGNNSWMVSTWRSVYCNFNPDMDVSNIYKVTGTKFRIIPTGVSKLSPTFAHFIGLKPRSTYNRLANYFITESQKTL